HVRVQADDGTHYLQKCVTAYYVPHGTTKPAEDMSNLVSDFTMNCYAAILFSKVDPKAKDMNGCLLWEIDRDQRSDMERLRAMTWPPENKEEKHKKVEWWEWEEF